MNAGYVRLSRDDDKRNYVSIENQMLIIRQYASKKNLSIDRWYEDDGISGYIFDRPGFNRLMEDLDRDIDTVFVKDFSRLGRHNAKVLLLLEEFRERGKQLVVIDDAYDSFSSDDDTIGIKTWYNERYVKDTSRKIRCALKARQKEGTLITQPPFGYKRSETDKRLLEIIPQEAEYVNMVFDLYIKGFGYRKIAAYLAENHVPTPSMVRHQHELEEGRSTKRQPAVKWSDGMVKDLLNNDFYMGTLRLHKRERAAIHGKDKRVPKEMQNAFENHHPPIIDPITFDLVQNIKEKRVKNNYRGCRGQWSVSQIPNPFGSCLFCRDCGSRLTPIVRQTSGSSGSKRKYYICSAYNAKGRNFCSKAHLIGEKDLMGDLVTYLRLCRDSLEEMIDSYDRNSFKQENTAENEKQLRTEKMILQQKKQLKAILSQKLMDLALNPEQEELIHETYDSLQKDVLSHISNLELELKDLKETKRHSGDAEKKPQTALEAFDKIIQKGILDRRDVETLIERIMVDENGLPEIQLKHGLSQLIGRSPSQVLNERENSIICTIMKSIHEEKRDYTSAKYLCEKLREAGYEKSRSAVLPYIGLMLDIGVLRPCGSSSRPYVIGKTKAEIKELMAIFTESSPPSIPPG